jgi:hypothetical protein
MWGVISNGQRVGVVPPALLQEQPDRPEAVSFSTPTGCPSELRLIYLSDGALMAIALAT